MPSTFVYTPRTEGGRGLLWQEEPPDSGAAGKTAVDGPGTQLAMRNVNTVLAVFLTLVATPLASNAGSYQSRGDDDPALANAFGRSSSQDYLRVAAQSGADRSQQSTGISQTRMSAGALGRFRVPANAPYFAHELIEAAKLGNTAAGVAAMTAASAKVRAAARAAIVADGFGGTTKKTASAEIEAYFTWIARNNPAAAIELSVVIAPGTGLHKALRPSRAVAASLNRMAVIARSNLRSAPPTTSPSRQVDQRLPNIVKEEPVRARPAAVAQAGENPSVSYLARTGDAQSAMPVQYGSVAPRLPSRMSPTAGFGNQVAISGSSRFDGRTWQVHQAALASRHSMTKPAPRTVTAGLSFLTSLSYAGGHHGPIGQTMARPAPRTVTTGLSFLTSLNHAGGHHSPIGQAMTMPTPRTVTTGLSFLTSLNHAGSRHSETGPADVATSLNFLASLD
jgi:hypothetical protein